MFQPPEDFETNPFFSKRAKENKREELTAEELAEIAPEDLLYRKKEMSKIFIWLIGFGLGLGIIVAITVIIALNKFGLTTKPYELETEPTEPQSEQVEQISTWQLEHYQ